ncbi:hypothetical protein HK102_004116, partial [Quaeritorhiza haematococci]
MSSSVVDSGNLSTNKWMAKLQLNSEQDYLHLLVNLASNSAQSNLERVFTQLDFIMDTKDHDLWAHGLTLIIRDSAEDYPQTEDANNKTCTIVLKETIIGPNGSGEPYIQLSEKWEQVPATDELKQIILGAPIGSLSYSAIFRDVVAKFPNLQIRCIGSWKNMRHCFLWNGTVLEVDRTTFSFGEGYFLRFPPTEEVIARDMFFTGIQQSAERNGSPTAGIRWPPSGSTLFPMDTQTTVPGPVNPPPFVFADAQGPLSLPPSVSLASSASSSSSTAPGPSSSLPHSIPVSRGPQTQRPSFPYVRLDRLDRRIHGGRGRNDVNVNVMDPRTFLPTFSALDRFSAAGSSVSASGSTSMSGFCSSRPSSIVFRHLPPTPTSSGAAADGDASQNQHASQQQKQAQGQRPPDTTSRTPPPPPPSSLWPSQQQQQQRPTPPTVPPAPPPISASTFPPPATAPALTTPITTTSATTPKNPTTVPPPPTTSPMMGIVPTPAPIVGDKFPSPTPTPTSLSAPSSSSSIPSSSSSAAVGAVVCVGGVGGVGVVGAPPIPGSVPTVPGRGERTHMEQAIESYTNSVGVAKRGGGVGFEGLAHPPPPRPPSGTGSVSGGASGGGGDQEGAAAGKNAENGYGDGGVRDDPTTSPAGGGESLSSPRSSMDMDPYSPIGSNMSASGGPAGRSVSVGEEGRAGRRVSWTAAGQYESGRRPSSAGASGSGGTGGGNGGSAGSGGDHMRGAPIIDSTNPTPSGGSGGSGGSGVTSPGGASTPSPPQMSGSLSMGGGGYGGGFGGLGDEIPDQDLVEVQRKRNREASARYRKRKQQELSEFKDEIKSLKTRVEELETENRTLLQENRALRQQLAVVKGSLAVAAI